MLTVLVGCKNSNNNVFKSGKKWYYSIELSDSTYEFSNLTLEATGGLFFLVQDKVVWNAQYTDNSNGNKIHTTSTTGVYEDKNRIWLHPPRMGPLKMLEAFPFPEVRFPFEINKSWNNSIKVIHGFEKLNGKKVISNYKIDQVYGDSICEISAKSIIDSLDIKHHAKFTFHYAKGFTDMTFIVDTAIFTSLSLQ